MADKDVKAPAPRKAEDKQDPPVKQDPAAEAPVSVEQLPTEREIAARTAPDADPGNRFVKVFVVQGRDYRVEGPLGDMHRANQVATLQEAINRGMHPKGGARFDGDEDTADGSVRLSYSVEVVLASEDSDPASTYTPSFSIADFGGSTIKDAAQPE